MKRRWEPREREGGSEGMEGVKRVREGEVRKRGNAKEGEGGRSEERREGGKRGRERRDAAG